MKKACKDLEGQHDFINFSKREKLETNSVRDMESAKVSVMDDYLIFQFKSRAFLRQQVRRMVKKILELGLSEITYADFIQLFDPTQEWSFQPADARGLILWDITYGDNIKIIEDVRSRERMENFFLKKKLSISHKAQLFHLLQHNDFC